MPTDYAVARRYMVEALNERGIRDSAVLEAMLKIPRHLFVQEALQAQAYSDQPLPIGEKQTISHPYIVAYMTAALQLSGTERVLEIGTGSGYQAAILGTLVRRVYSLERLPSLARKARQILDRLSLGNVHIRVSDGTSGWKEQGPFDRIIVTAGAPSVPQSYLDQLEDEGVLVIPVGEHGHQVLTRIVRRNTRFIREELLDCRFVPLIGRHGWQKREGRSGE